VIIAEDDYLAHYGTLRKSGRYPWGSGETQSARNQSFLNTIGEMRRNGMTDAQIGEAFSTKEYPLNSASIKALRSQAGHEQTLEKVQTVNRLLATGMSPSAVGREMGINESSVRSLAAPGRAEKADAIRTTANMIKAKLETDDLVFVDVGVGVENQMGITPDRLKTAVVMLREEGYGLHRFKLDTATSDKPITYKLVSKPGVHTREVFKNLDKIQQISERSDDNGRSFPQRVPPVSVSSKRVAVKYAEEGGAAADGVIHLRPGAEGLSLGNSRYAQVRITVDDTHYLKGMAVYKDDLPDGVDIVFNTNKSNTGNKKDAMKPFETDIHGNVDKLNPFGSAIKLGGQRGHLNIVNEEGDWREWSKSLSSQFLSKQKPEFAKTQLELTHTQRKAELEEILSLTNPSVKKKMLQSFSDDADSAAVQLQAASMPGTANHVILPIKSIKENEIYAPNFKDGDRVALVRHPHGGTFEIPELTVNNKNREAKKTIGPQSSDAVGIHHKVAERLSGADFDGDTVLVIKNNRGSVTSTPALEKLKGFDSKMYRIPEGSNIPVMTKSAKGGHMGNISNLITDMSLQGAGADDMSRAIRHSMVVIDAVNHKLDYKASARDHGIAALKEKYQGAHNAGAATLLSRSTSKDRANLHRELRPARDGGPIDKATGKLVYVETGKGHTSKTGEWVPKKQPIKRGYLTDDAHTLKSSPQGLAMENIYADHSNRLRSMANVARKEMVHTEENKKNPASEKVYAKEVKSLNDQLNIALQNAPRERQAQAVANTIIRSKLDSNPNIEKDAEKKIRRQALEEARARTGASKQRIKISPEEWNAIQAGAISPNKLNKILRNSDIGEVKKLAMPRTAPVMTPAKQASAKAKLAAGYSQAEVAASLGIPISTIMSSIG
jgi:hypothetical protein